MTRVRHLAPIASRCPRTLAAFLLALATLATAGCGAREETGVVARIGDEAVIWEEYDEYLRGTVERPSELDSAALSRLFDQYLDGRLLMLLARDEGFAGESDEPRHAVAYLLANARPTPVAETAVEDYYAEHREDYARPERIRLRQILVDTAEEAAAALAVLETDDDFAAVARRLSKGPRAHQGGDQGWLGRDDLPLAFADVIDRLAPGEHSPPVEADYGYHIFQVVERSPAATAEYSAVAEEIRQDLERRRVDAHLADLLAEAHQRFGVEVYPQSFPFKYRGTHARSEIH